MVGRGEVRHNVLTLSAIDVRPWCLILPGSWPTRPPQQKREQQPLALCATNEDYRRLIARGSGPPRCTGRVNAIKIATEPCPSLMCQRDAPGPMCANSSLSRTWFAHDARRRIFLVSLYRTVLSFARNPRYEARDQQKNREMFHNDWTRYTL
jgi:hypothetical protein